MFIMIIIMMIMIMLQERFAPELKYEIALRLAALHIHQHAVSNGLNSGNKVTITIVTIFTNKIMTILATRKVLLPYWPKLPNLVYSVFLVYHLLLTLARLPSKLWRKNVGWSDLSPPGTFRQNLLNHHHHHHHPHTSSSPPSSSS